jgi:hypothetical protein
MITVNSINPRTSGDILDLFMEIERLFLLNFKSHNNNNNNNIGAKLHNNHWYDHVLKSVEKCLEIKVLWNQ